MSYEIAPTPMIRNKVYPANLVPMYQVPFRSDTVWGRRSNGDVTKVAFNHWSCTWLIDSTNEHINDLVEWWGPAF